LAPLQFLLSTDVGDFESSTPYLPVPLFSRLKLSEVNGLLAKPTLQLIVCSRLITTVSHNSSKAALRVRVFLPSALGAGFETLMATPNTLASEMLGDLLLKRSLVGTPSSV